MRLEAFFTTLDRELTSLATELDIQSPPLLTEVGDVSGPETRTQTEESMAAETSEVRTIALETLPPDLGVEEALPPVEVFSDEVPPAADIDSAEMAVGGDESVETEEPGGIAESAAPAAPADVFEVTEEVETPEPIANVELIEANDVSEPRGAVEQPVPVELVDPVEEERSEPEVPTEPSQPGPDVQAQDAPQNEATPSPAAIEKPQPLRSNLCAADFLARVPWSDAPVVADIVPFPPVGERQETGSEAKIAPPLKGRTLARPDFSSLPAAQFLARLPWDNASPEISTLAADAEEDEEVLSIRIATDAPDHAMDWREAQGRMDSPLLVGMAHAAKTSLQYAGVGEMETEVADSTAGRFLASLPWNPSPN